MLAKEQRSKGLVAVGEEVRENGRRAIHRGEVGFGEWLDGVSAGAELDLGECVWYTPGGVGSCLGGLDGFANVWCEDGLIPFTRWITPTNVPKRYTTQMYLYFLPLPIESDKRLLEELPAEGEREELQVPTSDGGIEVTEATFQPASEWLRKARAGEIILFPPQYLLLHLVAEFLDVEPRTASAEELGRRRKTLTEFVHSGDPNWMEKCISPKMLKMSGDGRAVLALDEPGPELQGSDRRGESDRVVLVKFAKGTARQLDVRWKKDVFEEDRKSNL